MNNWRDDVVEWLKKKGWSKTRLAKESSIPPSTFRDMLNPKICSPLRDDRRKRLYEVTKISSLERPFKDEKILSRVKPKTDIRKTKRRELTPEIIEGVRGLAGMANYLSGQLEELESPKQTIDYTVQEYKVVDAFYDLVDALEYFKQAPLREIKRLTQRIDPKHVGYLTAFFNALYKTDQFNSWVKMSGFTPRRPKESKENK